MTNPPSLDSFVICLGANTPDAAIRIADAFDFIASLGSVEKSSSCYPTEPEFSGDTEPYLNRVLILRSSLPLDDLHSRLKAYETTVRALNSEPARVNLDIDIVLHNSTILRPRDFTSEHFRLGAREICLKVIPKAPKDLKDPKTLKTPSHGHV